VKKCEGIGATLLFVLALAARAPAEPAEGLETNADLRLGVARAPFFTEDYPQAKGRGGVLSFGGSWHIKSRIGVGLMVPLGLVRITEPDGRYTDEPAWGNPMVSAEGWLSLARGPRVRVDGMLRLGVGAPLADFGPPSTLSKSRALAIADAIDGWQNREMFAPGLLPFTVTTAVTFEKGVFRGEGGVKLAPMVRIDDADLPAGTARPFAFTGLVTARGAVWPFPTFGFGALAALSFEAVPQATTTHGQPLQFVLGPLMAFRAGSKVKLGTEFLVPLGGALGGSTYGLGFDAAVDW
jgi:hypothetical protein